MKSAIGNKLQKICAADKQHRKREGIRRGKRENIILENKNIGWKLNEKTFDQVKKIREDVGERERERRYDQNGQGKGDTGNKEMNHVGGKQMYHDLGSIQQNHQPILN